MATGGMHNLRIRRYPLPGREYKGLVSMTGGLSLMSMARTTRSMNPESTAKEGEVGLVTCVLWLGVTTAWRHANLNMLTFVVFLMGCSGVKWERKNEIHVSHMTVM